MRLKLTWDEYKKIAYDKIKISNPNIKDIHSVKFMQANTYEPDSTCYTLHDYVEFDLREEKEG